MGHRKINIVNDFYRAARTINTLDAASKGPIPLAKRVVRKKVYAKSMGLTARLLRKIGLQ